ncbi:MAG: response regulator [Campylobacterota bacterium]|nr:response regulator [Campylobacterota bacterium]
MKVLIVEDNEFNYMVLQDMIEILFPNVEVAIHDSAVKSLEEGSHEQYGLILSDIDMPEMSGFEFFTKLRELGFTMPVIAVTALAVTGDKDKILMHGFSDYVSKPIDLNELQRVLEKYIKV